MKENARITREKDEIENERDLIELSRAQRQKINVEPPTIDFTLTIATAVGGGILALLLGITLYREVMEKNFMASKLSDLENLHNTRYVPVYLLCLFVVIDLTSFLFSYLFTFHATVLNWNHV